MNACTAQPISWLKLEQYQLGELGADETRRVEAHLEECEACRACLDTVRRDEAALKPLPEVARRAPVLRWVSAGTALAAAAALLLVLLMADWEKAMPDLPGSKIAFKGGELSLSLVRERRGAILHDPETFVPGDRFKVQVTCPPTEDLFWDVAVFQDDETSFPYDPREPLKCGNRVPLPGAFSLTGESAATVCLVVSTRPPDRAYLSPEGLPADTVCTGLRAGK